MATDVSPFIPNPDAIGYGTALDNPAVARSVVAAHKAFLAAIANGKPDFVAESEGAAEFRRAMPPLVGQGNIREFIACVAYGMMIRAFDSTDGARLLYAAQCAVGADRRTPVMPKSE